MMQIPQVCYSIEPSITNMQEWSRRRHKMITPPQGNSSVTFLSGSGGGSGGVKSSVLTQLGKNLLRQTEIMKDLLAMRQKEFDHQELKDQLKSSLTLKDINGSNIDMLKMALATFQDLSAGVEPADIADSCKDFLNYKKHSLAHVELDNQLRIEGYLKKRLCRRVRHKASTPDSSFISPQIADDLLHLHVPGE